MYSCVCLSKLKICVLLNTTDDVHYADIFFKVHIKFSLSKWNVKLSWHASSVITHQIQMIMLCNLFHKFDTTRPLIDLRCRCYPSYTCFEIQNSVWFFCWLCCTPFVCYNKPYWHEYIHSIIEVWKGCVHYIEHYTFDHFKICRSWFLRSPYIFLLQNSTIHTVQSISIPSSILSIQPITFWFSDRIVYVSKSFVGGTFILKGNYVIEDSL